MTTRDILITLVALILVVEGVNLGLMSHKLATWYPIVRVFGLAMLGLGIALLVWFMRERESGHERVNQLGSGTPIDADLDPDAAVGPAADADASLLARLFTWLTARLERVSFYLLPIIGALVIDAVLMYNLFTGQGLAIHGWDLVTLLFGGALVAYNFIPKRYAYAANFAVFFLGILFLILVFPQVIGNLFTNQQTVARVTQTLLANPTAAFVRVFGVDATTSIEMTSGTPTSYLHFAFIDGGTQSLGIGQSCSGIYTASIFIAAFVTYILTEYGRLDRAVVLVLAAGVIVSYLANIFRMGVIVLVGYYYGMDALLWTHANAGWLIFLGWMVPFWYGVVRWLHGRAPTAVPGPGPT